MSNNHRLCPFCGGEPEIRDTEQKVDRVNFYGYKYICCTCCGATSEKVLVYKDWDNGYDCGPRRYYNSDEIVWNKWDNRTDVPRKTLKIIVAGERDFDDYKLLENKLNDLFKNINPIIVCGEAKGADSLGRRYAEEHGRKILSYPAKWDEYGKSAGYRRNEEMAAVADGLVAFWDGESKGTKHMIEYMQKLGKKVRIVKYEKHYDPLEFEDYTCELLNG